MAWKRSRHGAASHMLLNETTPCTYHWLCFLTETHHLQCFPSLSPTTLYFKFILLHIIRTARIQTNSFSLGKYLLIASFCITNCSWFIGPVLSESMLSGNKLSYSQERLKAAVSCQYYSQIRYAAPSAYFLWLADSMAYPMDGSITHVQWIYSCAVICVLITWDKAEIAVEYCAYLYWETNLTFLPSDAGTNTQ